MTKQFNSIFHRPGFLLFVAVLALLNNLEHSTHLYNSISDTMFDHDWMNWVYCTFVNLLIDLAVIAFVVNGRHKEAGLYAFLIFLINLLYYKGLGIFPIEVNDRIAYVIYSFMFTYSIYIFSKLYFAKLKKDETAYDLYENLRLSNEKIHSINESIKELTEAHTKKDLEIRQLNEKMLILNESNKELSYFRTKRIAELTCKECGHIAENDFGVSGHKKGCKLVHA